MTLDERNFPFSQVDFVEGAYSFSPVRLNTQSDGQSVVRADVVLGLAGRDILSRVNDRHWASARFLWPHISIDTGVHFEHLFSLAVEEGMMVAVSDRATRIRGVVSGLSEVNRCLSVISSVLYSLKIKPMYSATLRLKEGYHDLLEFLTGSRHGYYYLVPGGLRWDISDGFLIRCEEWVQELFVKICAIEEALELSFLIQPSLKNMGRLSFWQNEEIETSLQYRVRVQFDRIRRCSSRVLELIQNVPSGPVAVSGIDRQGFWADQSRSASSVQSKINTVRGQYVLSCKIHGDGRLMVDKLSTPSDWYAPWARAALVGVPPLSVPVVLSSLDVIPHEVDL